VNHVLESLRAQRAEQIATMDAILEQVEGRDLVDAERGLLEAARNRIGELDAQIAPLEAFEAMRGAHAETVAGLPAPAAAAASRAVGVAERPPLYRTAGEFVVDYLRARGIGTDGVRDEAAAQRVMQARAIADQKTSDTPGILPTPIVGGVVSMIDANRPFISSLGGAKPLAGIPGSTFTRPKIAQHTTVGPQAGEKTQLPSQKMIVNSVPFNKATYGGTVDISRQDIDWTSPAAWDILVKDLADVYAIQTETAAATAFHTALTAAPVVVATNDLKGWTLALYTAAMHSYQGALRMPDRIWCSLDVWAALGSLVDVARVSLPRDGNLDTAAGASTLASFAGDMLGVPRIVVPTFAAGTCVVGPSTLFEVYEEVIGLLSVIEPSILGVQVAYGGYVAQGTLAAAGFVPLTAPAGMPTALDADEAEARRAADDDDATKAARGADDDAGGASGGNGGRRK
jgi:HK97 family phage major capsid protein